VESVAVERLALLLVESVTVERLELLESVAVDRLTTRVDERYNGTNSTRRVCPTSRHSVEHDDIHRREKKESEGSIAFGDASNKDATPRMRVASERMQWMELN
jgi:hypothetical protein